MEPNQTSYDQSNFDLQEPDRSGDYAMRTDEAEEYGQYDDSDENLMNQFSF